MTSNPDLIYLAPSDLRPNPWNPNRMDPEMYEKEIASIRAFGFVDPITVREQGGFEIIDGEHRWKAAIDEGLDEVPVVNLGVVADDVAKQLTIVLNETRGQSDPRRLGDLLRDLASRNTMDGLLQTLPYTRESFSRLTGLSTIDWSSITPPQRPAAERPSAWVERTYRMPKEAAEVIDRALARIRDEEVDIPDWKALELIAADFLGT